MQLRRMLTPGARKLLEVNRGKETGLLEARKGKKELNHVCEVYPLTEAAIARPDMRTD